MMQLIAFQKLIPGYGIIFASRSFKIH